MYYTIGRNKIIYKHFSGKEYKYILAENAVLPCVGKGKSMSLYAIGDLHLHFNTELKARMQLTDRVWKDHEVKFRRNCENIIGKDDTLLLLGDHSWGRNLEECGEDMEYICSLPGRKILLRGNHDMFWDVKKTQRLNEIYKDKLLFLQNNYYTYRSYAIVGTKGYTFEGPFWKDPKGRIVKWDREEKEKADKLVEREAERLRASFRAAAADGYERFIMLLHYPPTNIMEEESLFTEIAEEYGVSQVIYAHCHGKQRFEDSLSGMHRGIFYALASGDYLGWMPLKIL